ncbi:MAG: hypothetical protein LC804_15880 [Acidobacteria bacterium]|nr:hypothetical protein [Acidobacteriota bacterium]
MYVRIVEARHDKTAAGVEDLRGRSSQLAHVGRRSHPTDDLSADRDRRRRRLPPIDRVDLGVHNNEVGRESAAAAGDAINAAIITTPPHPARVILALSLFPFPLSLFPCPLSLFPCPFC